MRVLKFFLYGLVALLVLIVAVGFVLPSKYHVERWLEIKAPAEKVFGLVERPEAVGDVERLEQARPGDEGRLLRQRLRAPARNGRGRARRKAPARWNSRVRSRRS